MLYHQSVKKLRVQLTRALQLLASREFGEFYARLSRKLSAKGLFPEAMLDARVYEKWLAAHTVQPRQASPISWDVLTVIPSEGDEPQVGSEQARWLVADCRTRTSRADNNTVVMPQGLRARPQMAWQFLLNEASAEWLLIVPPGAELVAGALAWLSAASAGADVIYGDDDLLSTQGRVSPRLQPAWSSERFFCDGYALPCFAIRRAFLNEVGFRGDLGFYDLVLRAEEKGARIARVPHILVSLRARPQLGATEKRAAQLALSRRKQEGSVVLADGRLRVVRQAKRDEAVSIIIPFRDRAELLDQCLQSLTAKTRHQRFDVLLVDNGSREEATELSVARWQRELQAKVLRRPGAFNFAWLNNEAAKEATNPYLLLLNNDTEVVSPDWLDEMLAFAVRPDVGAVGAKLLYPDGTLQHAGVVLGVAGAAAHICVGLPSDAPGHAGQLLVPRNVAAVTGACLLVARDKYAAVGGLDERRFRVAFNDLDLCIKLAARGWRTVYTPHAVLVHHESKSRGSRVDMSEDREFRQRYAALIADDPYYHPLLSRVVPDDRLA